MKTAVLLHGYNANEKNWDYVVWGESPDKPGRIPTAVAVALEENAELLVLFGSSIGKEDESGVWKSSGKLMTELLFRRFEELGKFTILHALREIPLKKIRRRIEVVYRLVEELERPANTFGEMQTMARLIQEKGIQKLVCVSSPDHVSRIIRDTLVVFRKTTLAVHVSVRPSVTLYTVGDDVTPPERASLGSVVVIEPRSPVGPLAQRMLGLGGNANALAEIDAILKKYGK